MHNDYGHKIDECFHLKDKLERLIKENCSNESWLLFLVEGRRGLIEVHPAVGKKIWFKYQVGLLHEVKLNNKKFNALVQSVLTRGIAIKEENQRCIMSIQVLEEQENSSFGEIESTLRCTPQLHYAVPSETGMENFTLLHRGAPHTYIVKLAHKIDLEELRTFSPHCPPDLHFVSHRRLFHHVVLCPDTAVSIPDQ